MLKPTIKFISENSYLFLGIIIGLYISSFVSISLDISCDSTENSQKVNSRLAQEIINSSINRLAPRILPEKAKGETKSKFVRPRYYSTELGIREKLFVGIFTSEDKVNTQAVHINKTIGHIVDKIKFFITAQYKLKTKFNLTGLVGFTDARSKYRPFQVIKYVADTFSQDYDYYFFSNDYTFINIHRLRDVVDKISVSMDVYLGTRVPDSSYCNLDAGIIISNSVLQATRKHLEWCIMNAVSDDYSENLGRCIHHSLGLSCQQTVQGQKMQSFKLRHFDLSEHLLDLSKNEEFNTAVTVRPVISNGDFFRLNAYFVKQRLEMYNKQIEKLSKSLSDSWPPGQRTGAKPATRFDMPRQYYFNMSHIFFPDDFTIIRKHTEPETLDLQNVLKEVTAQISEKYPKEYEFRRLVNGYKTFDLSRGMDYTLDLGFRDLHSGKEIIKRCEVCKPLGNIEFIQAPYVTENTRVSIVLPIQENEIAQAMHFVNGFSSTIMDKKERILLMFIFVYQYSTESKGPADVFQPLKDFVTKSSAKFKNDDVKVSWVSIRLPEVQSPLTFEDNKALNFAVVDLALKKIGLDSLTLLLDVWCNITIDFLNRVRMNTIENYQIFSPIPFRQYNPAISHYVHLDVNKISGHFDREEYKYIAFYGRDYVAEGRYYQTSTDGAMNLDSPNNYNKINIKHRPIILTAYGIPFGHSLETVMYGIEGLVMTARKKFQQIVPLMRVDNDISKILDDSTKQKGNIFEMFVQYGEDLHCMRATEMNLKILYHFEKDKHKNKFYGNEAQLAKLLLTKQDSIYELL